MAAAKCGQRDVCGSYLGSSVMDAKCFAQRARVRARGHAGCTRQSGNGFRDMVVSRECFSCHVLSRKRVIKVCIHADAGRTITNRHTRCLPNVKRDPGGALHTEQQADDRGVWLERSSGWYGCCCAAMRPSSVRSSALSLSGEEHDDEEEEEEEPDVDDYDDDGGCVSPSSLS